MITTGVRYCQQRRHQTLGLFPVISSMSLEKLLAPRMVVETMRYIYKQQILFFSAGCNDVHYSLNPSAGHLLVILTSASR